MEARHPPRRSRGAATWAAVAAAAVLSAVIGCAAPLTPSPSAYGTETDAGGAGGGVANAPATADAGAEVGWDAERAALLDGDGGPGAGLGSDEDGAASGATDVAAIGGGTDAIVGGSDDLDPRLVGGADAGRAGDAGDPVDVSDGGVTSGSADASSASDAGAADSLEGGTTAADGDGGDDDDPSEGNPAFKDSKLVGGCHGWPNTPFSPGNIAKPSIAVSPGAAAPAFVLPDLKGAPRSLTGLLAKGPVVIVVGSTTCSLYRDVEADIQALVTANAAAVTFAFVYNIEAHPMAPEPSPYAGAVWTLGYSTAGQPTTWGERRDLAAELPATKGMVMLVDTLSEENANAFWCTYGTLPYGAFVIRGDGVLHEALMTPSAGALQAAIDSLP